MPASGGMWAARHEDRGGWVDEDTAGERRLSYERGPTASWAGQTLWLDSISRVHALLVPWPEYVAEMAVTGLTSTRAAFTSGSGLLRRRGAAPARSPGAAPGLSTVARAVRAEQKQQLRAGLGGWRSDVCGRGMGLDPVGDGIVEFVQRQAPPVEIRERRCRPPRVARRSSWRVTYLVHVGALFSGTAGTGCASGRPTRNELRYWAGSTAPSRRLRTSGGPRRRWSHRMDQQTKNSQQ